MTRYWNFKGGINPLEQWEPGCWIDVTAPAETEQTQICEKYGIPDYFIKDICDADERSRYDYDDGWELIIMRIPYTKENQSRTPFKTVPFGIIHKESVIITLCPVASEMLEDFICYQKRRKLGFIDFADMTFRLFLSSAVWYLKDLKQINTMIEKAKFDLDKNIDNKSLVSLSRLQDSLTYFITSIRGNESLLTKLKFRLPVDELDKELIEDTNIEMLQARETAQIYSTILDSTMETYSSVISNNLNTVMRVLTSVSIILMLPTLISSYFGMNLLTGIENKWWGFPCAFIFSLIVSLGCWLIFKKKKLI